MKIQWQEVNHPSQKIWVASEMPVDVDWFELNTAQNSEQILMGRASVKKLRRHDIPMILRHYYRGGMPARVSKDQFLFFGWKSTRAYRELVLLHDMTALGLPVPQPIAARSILHGLFYSSDIIMREIEHTKTLAQLLSVQAVHLSLWNRLGRTIKKFHTHGFEHVDLNANNILIDQNEKVYLIDFDRCRHRNYARRWAQRGIDRLHRSLKKIKQNNNHFHFDKSEFSSLLQGYDE
jgi:3-deoxy-D-manno-octulosonic acid kinase